MNQHKLWNLNDEQKQKALDSNTLATLSISYCNSKDVSLNQLCGALRLLQENLTQLYKSLEKTSQEITQIDTEDRA